MVHLRNMEGDFGGQLLLQQAETLKNRVVVAGDVDEEVVVVKRLELDLDVGRLHDLVNLPILFPADELAMLVGQLNLEAYFVMECLVVKLTSVRIRRLASEEMRTLIMSSSRTMLTAARTSCSIPCISKHIPLKTTSAPVDIETCLSKDVTWAAFSVVAGSSTLNCIGRSHKEAM